LHVSIVQYATPLPFSNSFRVRDRRRPVRREDRGSSRALASVLPRGLSRSFGLLSDHTTRPLVSSPVQRTITIEFPAEADCHRSKAGVPQPSVQSCDPRLWTTREVDSWSTRQKISSWVAAPP